MTATVTNVERFTLQVPFVERVLGQSPFAIMWDDTILFP